MKARKMKMARDFTLISKFGYTIQFDRDQPVRVPGLAIEEAITHGAGFCEEDEGFFPQEDLTVEEKPLYGPERKEMLLKVMKELKEKGNPDDFTATGAPRLQVVRELAGFDLDRKELGSVWMELLSGD